MTIGGPEGDGGNAGGGDGDYAGYCRVWSAVGTDYAELVTTGSPGALESTAGEKPADAGPGKMRDEAAGDPS